ncbi:hypothetical protein MTR_7g110840 [Medicago truncatula]|uniref:Uncharacterized protein n=1 Tax=Medicago truncatula TaxID=3880 RepID=G7KUN9_MEDTR|nr:hypothetical protein MTR_7g110840 [Medicago truncatula]
MRTSQALFSLEIEPGISRVRPWKELLATRTQVQLRFLQFFESLLVWIFAYKCSESWLANGDTWPQCHHLLSDREVVQQYWNQFITKDNWTKFLSLRLHACEPVFQILDALVDRPLYLASYTTMHITKTMLESFIKFVPTYFKYLGHFYQINFGLTEVDRKDLSETNSKLKGPI